MAPADPTPQHTNEWFVTTHWTVVLSARDQRTPEAAQALEALCRTYWYPLYAFVRRQGRSPADAQDLTQEFFARLLGKDYLHSVERGKGKFRTFLLVLLKRFLADEWDRAHAQKRGGGSLHLPLDTALAESRYQREQGEDLSPDKVYDRRWALTLLERAMARLREEFTAAGKADEFQVLKAVLTTDKGALAYGQLAGRLGVSEGAARVAAHRLRRRFRQLFREEIAHTVGSQDEVEEEVRYLMSLFG
jgi:RNA polymerase sigma factor (sigma-70 family)